MRKSRYEKGSYNAICDISGFKYKRSQMKKTWDGLLVGREWWDPKHPQLNVRGRRERLSVPDPRPIRDESTYGDTVGVLYAEIIQKDGSIQAVTNDLQTPRGSVRLASYLVYGNNQVEIFKSRVARAAL